MTREKKYGFIGSTIVVLFLGTTIFQNCAKVHYDESLNGTLGGLGTPSARKVTIDPSFNQQKANLKVLFVVDDSYTMSQSQSYLANAIDSLLSPLGGHNVEFKIVSTSGVPSNEVDYAISTKYMTENRLEVPSSQLTSLSSYLVEKSVVNNTNSTTRRHSNLKLYRSSTQAQIDAVKANIKSAILAVGVNGSDTEEGLCATARQLFDSSANRFFKAGDKAVIIILTDENDSSAFSKCVTRYVQRVSAAPVVYYNYGQQRARVSLEYQLVRDGVTSWNPVEWGVALNGPHTITNGATCSSADQNYAVDKITSQGYVVRNVSGCVYETIPASYYGADLGDDGSVAGKDLCTQQVRFNNTNYANLYAMVNAVGLSGQPNSCQKIVLPGNTLSSNIEFDSVIASDVSAAQSQNLSYAIKNKSVELFGQNGFTVASLIHKVGEPCNLQAGQTFGGSYEALSVILGSANSSTQSLCNTDFSSTLSQASNYLVTEAASSYVVSGLLDSEKIASVAVLRNGQRINLTVASDYEVARATITMTGFNLQSGDVLEVQITPL